MKSVRYKGIKFVIACAVIFGFTNLLGDVVDNLADTCGLTVVVNDESARKRMNKKLYYVKLKNSTLRGFLNTILKDNDLHYTLEGNKLKISYLITRTFKVHYIAGQRSGKSTANVTIANSQNSASSTGGVGGGGSGGGAGGSGSNISKTGISIESNESGYDHSYGYRATDQQSCTLYSHTYKTDQAAGTD